MPTEEMEVTNLVPTEDNLHGNLMLGGLVGLSAVVGAVTWEKAIKPLWQKVKYAWKTRKTKKDGEPIQVDATVR